MKPAQRNARREVDMRQKEFEKLWTFAFVDICVVLGVCLGWSRRYDHVFFPWIDRYFLYFFLRTASIMSGLNMVGIV